MENNITIEEQNNLNTNTIYQSGIHHFLWILLISFIWLLINSLFIFFGLWFINSLDEIKWIFIFLLTLGCCSFIFWVVWFIYESSRHLKYVLVIAKDI